MCSRQERGGCLTDRAGRTTVPVRGRAMLCGECGLENRPSVRFCEQCGGRLEPTCTACGAIVPLNGKFCGRCGHPLTASAPLPTTGPAPDTYTPGHLARRILSARHSIEGERKHVTVLFADVRGSLEMLADRDPEDVQTIFDPVLRRMMDAVHRYEGTVSQVLGDGIMAVFGAPLACEHHAVRACYAALDMQQKMARHETLDEQGADLKIRVGLNSGEVVVRSIGNDLHMDYTAIGETTHLAGRMEQIAAPGSILTTARTARLVQGYIELTSLGPRPVKGLGAPIDVYAVTGAGPVRTSLQAAMGRGLTRFVGRTAEIDALVRAQERARAGRTQVVGVVGQPGVGKSRLVHEFTGSEHMRGWLILQTGAASYGKSTVYRPVIDVLRTYFGVHLHDDEKDIREKVTTKTLALDEGLGPALPALLSLLDVSVDDPGWRAMEPRQRRRQTMDAVKRLFVRESGVRPLCLVFEDLHWVDLETHALLDDLIKSLTTAPVLLMLNFRPEFQHAWASEVHYVQLRLNPLPPTSIEELLRLLLGDNPSLAPVRRLLAEQTEGNPFFLEESVRTLVEHGALVGERGDYRAASTIEIIRVPATVQDVVAARIDRLAPADKRLLQVASVIGENVPLSLLQTVADMPEAELHERIDHLRSAEFLYDVLLFPEPEYVFRHGLTCQVAYDSLLRERRRALHARIVDAIERLHAGRLVEHVERLARHALRGELWSRAVHFLQEAGAKAFGRSANREAMTLFEQALETLREMPETPETIAQTADVLLRIRPVLMVLGEHERTLGLLHEVQVLAERIGDGHRLARAISLEVNCQFLLGQHEQALAAGRRVRAVAGELGDATLGIVTDMYSGRALLQLGEFSRAIDTLTGVVGALAGDLAHDHLGLPVLPAVLARSLLVESLVEVGRFDESARYVEEARSLAEITNQPHTVLWASYARGHHHLARGDTPAATDALEHASSLYRTHDLLTYGPRVSAELGMAWAMAGRAAEAVPMVRAAAAEASARKQTTSLSQVLLLLGEVSFLAGLFDEAAEAATRALDHFRRQQEKGHEVWALRLLADIAARQAPGTTGAAEAHYHAAMTLATKLGMLPLTARCEFGLSGVLRQSGRSERAVELLVSAGIRFRELGMRADLTRVEAELGALGGPKS
jgi:class 3 adenylate cyclase/tetratricopeptide (TPR) repeat protein